MVHYNGEHACWQIKYKSSFSADVASEAGDRWSFGLVRMVFALVICGGIFSFDRKAGL